MRLELFLPDDVSQFLRTYADMKGKSVELVIKDLLCGDVAGLVDDMSTEEFLKLLKLSQLLSDGQSR